MSKENLSWERVYQDLEEHKADSFTLESARRKGIGTEMTLIPLRDAKRRGYCVGVLHSSQVGKFVYDKIGFVEKCKIHAFRMP